MSKDKFAVHEGMLNLECLNQKKQENWLCYFK